MNNRPTDLRSTPVSFVVNMIRKMWPDDPTVEIETGDHQIRIVRQVGTEKVTIASAGNYTKLREQLVAIAMNPKGGAT